uniref:Peptidase M14 domain-containing protein n=1 Tax=Graphocephala atropunctata TaxID=36148 RepID=A0A1B6M1U1_9HEMI
MMIWKHASVLLLLLTAQDGIFGFDYSIYHNYEEMTAILKNISDTYDNLTELYSIGQSHLGRQLWVMKISGGEDEIMRPHIKFVANVHGNEAVGREILLRLVEYLAEQYNVGDERVTRLLDYAHVHILPSLNPDGFERLLNESRPGTEASAIHGGGCTNAQDVDINKDFNSKSPQSETLAVKKWMDEIPFVLSASLGGNNIVGFYPFDSDQSGDFSTVDEDVFKELAFVYAKNHPTMMEDRPCSGYDYDLSGGFRPGGRDGGPHTNLPIASTMMDYNYVVHGCMEISFQISCHKFPRPRELPTFWENNKESLLAYMEAARGGMRGLVMDEEGDPVVNATLRVLGRESSTFRSSSKGEFCRILLPSFYKFKVDAEGFEPRSGSTTVTSRALDTEWPQVVNITLYRPVARTSTSTTTQAPVPSEPCPTGYHRESPRNMDVVLEQEGSPTRSNGEISIVSYWVPVLLVCVFPVFVN